MFYNLKVNFNSRRLIPYMLNGWISAPSRLSVAFCLLAHSYSVWKCNRILLDFLWGIFRAFKECWIHPRHPSIGPLSVQCCFRPYHSFMHVNECTNMSCRSRGFNVRCCERSMNVTLYLPFVVLQSTFHCAVFWHEEVENLRSCHVIYFLND